MVSNIFINFFRVRQTHINRKIYATFCENKGGQLACSLSFNCSLTLQAILSYCTASTRRHLLANTGCGLQKNRLTTSTKSVSVEWGSRKRQRLGYQDKVSSGSNFGNMFSEEQESVLSPLRVSVKDQGDVVRRLKADKADPVTIKGAVTELKARMKALEIKELAFSPKEEKFDRLRMEDLLKQKFFYDLSFSIYGGIAGQYDFGPMGCALKTNIVDEWRKHFVLEENMLEVDCSILTPEPVLAASGHQERFADFMVKDLKNGECFRADHLIESLLEKYITGTKDRDQITEARKLISQLDNFNKEELQDVINRYGFKSPLTGNDLSELMDFNLMFATHIGPAGLIKGFLRPETAQGIFVNFKRLLEFNGGKLPFAAAQVGKAFRNEISPRSGLIRVREFLMAEIEYFCHHEEMRHPKFSTIFSLELPLLSACNQMDGKPPILTNMAKAVETELVQNETLAYFMARTFLYLKHIGMDEKRIRFRQHLSNEMAHYAKDCWDCEIKTSYGWVECVGHAYRSAFDLLNHTKATNTKLVAERKLAEPKTMQVNEIVADKSKLGKAFKKEAKAVTAYLAGLSDEQVLVLKSKLDSESSVTVDINGKETVIPSDMLTVKQYEKTLHVEEYVPHVIEPSFGIGRIMYALFEHTFKMREGDEQRTYLSLPPSVAPYKCSVLPLSNNPDFTPYTRRLSDGLRLAGVSHKVDETGGSIGRRYARTDQIAIPFGITIDFDTLQERTATLRERDSMQQIRAPLSELPDIVASLSNSNLTWSQVTEKYPKFEQQENTK